MEAFENSDSSDGSGSSSASEDDFQTRYTEILNKIEEDKYNYDLYKQLIAEAYKQDDLDKVRSAHDMFANVFPLSPTIWLKWIRLEVGLVNFENEIQVDRIMKLFDRALNDYYSPEVAIEYGTFLNQVQIEVPEVIWDRLLIAYGPLCRYGSYIFALYRSYYLTTKFIPETTIPTKIINNYMKELEMPLEDIDVIYEDLKMYCATEEENAPTINWEDVNRIYERSKKYLELILPYEMDLEVNNDYNNYINYLNDVENKIPDNWYQCIYERAITDLCLNEVIWIKYINYLWKRDKDKSPFTENLQTNTLFDKNAMDAINQALRNCPWVPQLYALQMNVAEDNYLKYPIGRVKSILENAFDEFNCTKSSVPYLWLEYLSYLKRNTALDNSDELDIFRQDCEEALVMSTPDPDENGTTRDPYYQIYRFWGTIEYKFGYIVSARTLWQTVTNNIKGINLPGIWLQYANLEIQNGSIGEAREILRQGAQAITLQTFDLVNIMHESLRRTDSTSLRAARILMFEQIYMYNTFWMEFERTYGDFKSIREAEQCIGEVMKNLGPPEYIAVEDETTYEERKRIRHSSYSQIRNRRRNDESETAWDLPQDKEVGDIETEWDLPQDGGVYSKVPTHRRFDNIKTAWGQQQDAEVDTKKRKRRRGDDIETAWGQQQDAEVDSKKRKRRRDDDIETAWGQQQDAEVDSKKRKRRRGDDIETAWGQPQHQRTKVTSKVLKLRHNDNAETKRNLPQYQHTEVDTTKDSVTVFLSNLKFSITEEEVRSGFPELTIEKVNLIQTSQGKGRGFGYLQLDSEESVKLALTFDKRPIKGRPVFISTVIRDKNKRGIFRYSENREDNKIFIKGIPSMDSDIVENELTTLFSKYGEIKAIRTVNHKTGVSKGIAYIEYADEESAAKAVNDTAKKTIGDAELFVAISAPPSRSDTAKDNKKITDMPGWIHVPMKPPTDRPKPRMNLIPVSVTKAMKTNVIPSTSQSSDENQKTGKTNEDFQEMFAKKN